MPKSPVPPGVYVEEAAVRAPIARVPTAITAFVGLAEQGPLEEPVGLRSFAAFIDAFGSAASPLRQTVEAFFASGGRDAVVVRLPKAEAAEDWLGERVARRGLHALEACDLFNLLCLPPASAEGDLPFAVWQAAAEYCLERRAFLLVDPPAAWGRTPPEVLPVADAAARNAAFYFPRLRAGSTTAVPCGAVAGVMARSDAARGVWKAPAGLEATLQGYEPALRLTDQEQARFNPLGINLLRSFPAAGTVVWGSRTLAGGDQRGDAYKYVPVRRLALMIEESLSRGLRWAAFEANAAPLWTRARTDAEDFLLGLFRDGAFAGTRPQEAYFVRCDQTTMSADDIAQGRLILQLGFAPLKPAEFIMLRLCLRTAD